MKIRYFLLLIAYYLIVVLPHEHVGKLIASIFLPGSRVRYDGIMLAILCLILAFATIWAWRKIALKDRTFIALYTLLTCVFIVLCVNLLFVLNVEAIHFIQYAVFAIICFQITKSYWKTLFWSIIAGSVDELYQYMYLAPSKSEYYDFNDVVINAVGAGIGLMLIRVINPSVHTFKRDSVFKSIEIWTLIGLIAFIIIGLIVGFISYGPDPDALFCFMKAENINFWYTVKTGPKVLFHVIKPIEGAFLVLVLFVVYSYLEKGSSSIEDSSKLIKND